MNTALQLVTAPVADPVTIADLKVHSKIDTTAEDSELAGYLAAATQTVEGHLNRALMPQTWRYSLQNFPGRNYVNGVRDFSSLAEYYRWNFIEIPRPPLRSISLFTYTDTQGIVGNMQQGYDSAVGNYLLDVDSEPGRVVLPYSGLWPTTVLSPSLPIALTFLCGYSAMFGTADVSTTGIVTWKTGNKFTAALQGTWITINGNSYNVLTFTDDQHLQLVAAPAGLISGGAFAASEVPMGIRQAILMLAAHFIENREGVLVAKSALAAVELPFGIERLLDRYRVWHTPPR